MNKRKLPPKAVAEATVLLSGGLDSAACAHLLKGEVEAVKAIFFDFGQAAAAPEYAAAKRLAKVLEIPLRKIKLPGHGSFGTGELIGRNAFLVFSAIFLAPVHSGLVALGIHEGTPYYDCSPTFLDRMRTLTEEHTEGRLTVAAPFIAWPKGRIFNYFVANKLPLELTYSCEAGTVPPCGVCASCGDRRALGC